MDWPELITTVRSAYTILRLEEKFSKLIQGQDLIVGFLRSIAYEVECPEFTHSNGCAIFNWHSQVSLVLTPVSAGEVQATLDFNFPKSKRHWLVTRLSSESISPLAMWINRDVASVYPYVSTKTWKDLKPCPFCGWHMSDEDEVLYPAAYSWAYNEAGWKETLSHSETLERKATLYYHVHCAEVSGGCGAEISGKCIDEVVAKWNRRV